MAGITLRVLDGADRGRVFANLQPPITIGREEGNSIQVNDERVSRFHVKIMKDHDRIVLTDLDSTNGTKVNNEDAQLRNLRPGDLIHVGRTVLVFGTREEIAERLEKLRNGKASGGNAAQSGGDLIANKVSPVDVAMNWRENDDLQEALFMVEPPELPDRLSPGQAAQLQEVLSFFHIRTRHLLAQAQSHKRSGEIRIPLSEWQMLVDMQGRLAEYLKAISEPDQSSC